MSSRSTGMLTLETNWKCSWEISNTKDPCVVAVIRKKIAVGHLPREISPIIMLSLKWKGTVHVRR